MSIDGILLDRDLAALLRRGAAAIETPGDLTDEERGHVAEDLALYADKIDPPEAEADDGTNGQDREGYSDTQDRESYTVDVDGDDEDKLIVIWRLPYKAPQEAIGLFTLTEASGFLGLPADEITAVLNATGAGTTEKYRLEYDE